MHPDALVCSHPRSGGRWLRYLISHYLAARHGLEIEVTPRSVFAIVPDHHPASERGYPALAFGARHDVPLVAVSHQPYTWEDHRGFPVVFLARNAYDVMVSGFFYQTGARSATPAAMRDFIADPRTGVGAWIEYVNSWAPALLTHRDALLLSYGQILADPGGALTRVLAFLHEPIEPALVAAAVASAAAERSARGIRTGQEGTFWDHLQPEEIFDIQEALHRGLSDLAVHLLDAMGVEVDPFPRVP